MTKAPAKTPKGKCSAKRSNQRTALKAIGTATQESRPAAGREDPAGHVTSGNPTKLDLLAGLLNSPGGASIAELAEATGWQTHSVRGAMSGALKRKGLIVTSEVTDGVRRYRIGSPG